MKQFQKARFLLSVTEPKQLPPDEGAEVAFVGRSNAGKSSVINKLTQQNNLARVSKTPGRTQAINLFALDESRRLADLPGYGYARVPDELKERWQKNIDIYFQTRACLKGLILVMDIRHPFQVFDEDILEGSTNSGLPVHILLNKADKLGKNGLRKVDTTVREAIKKYGDLVSFQTFSALKNEGIKELQLLLSRWFLFEK